MKATLATLACLLTVGFLSAAEVTGNNTAVVIRKNAVQAKNGYQFLCVPVNGLNIAGAENGEVALETMLPAATLPVGSRVMATIGNDTVTYATTDAGWPLDQDGNPIKFKGGQIFWLNTKVRNGGTAPDTVIFCGQNRGREVLLSLSAGVVALKNDSSEKVTLVQAVNMADFEPQHGDQILTIQDGSSEYTTYQFLNGNWYGPGFNNVCDTKVTIAPGEAFYYYNGTADGVVGDGNPTDGE